MTFKNKINKNIKIENSYHFNVIVKILQCCGFDLIFFTNKCSFSEDKRRLSKIFSIKIFDIYTGAFQ